MSDFMREVDEEYRRERTMRFLSRYQILIAATIIAVIVGAGVWRFIVDRRVTAAAADNSRLAAAEKDARDGAIVDARKIYSDLMSSGVAGYPLLAGMRDAEQLVSSDPEGAAKRFDAVASGEGVSQAMRDAARYRGALIRADRETPQRFEEQYGRFALEGFAFHAGIRELLALAALKRGDGATAQRYLGEIVIDGAAPSALRNRAQAFLDLARSGSASASDKPAPPATVAASAAPATTSDAPSPATTAPAETAAKPAVTSPTSQSH